MANPDNLPTAVEAVIHRPGFSWSQFDLGAEMDAGALSVIAELDPTGENGVVEEILAMFERSLDPVLTRLEQVRAERSGEGLRFEAHKLYSAAAQVGAKRVATACAALTRHFHVSEGWSDAGARDAERNALYDELVVEIIRVQRKVRHLLAE